MNDALEKTTHEKLEEFVFKRQLYNNDPTHKLRYFQELCDLVEAEKRASVTAAIEEVIFVLDELENSEGSRVYDEMEAWRLWKYIRNTLRDRFKVQADYTTVHRKFSGKEQQ